MASNKLPFGYDHAYYQVLVNTFDKNVSDGTVVAPTVAVEYSGIYYILDPKMYPIVYQYLQTHDVPQFFFKTLCSTISQKDVPSVCLWKLICFVEEDQ